MTPIEPTVILSMVQSGYPVDLVFRLAVQAINGIHNSVGRVLRAGPAEPKFYTLLEKLKRVQDSQAFRIRVNKTGDMSGSMIVFKGEVNQAIEADNNGYVMRLGLIQSATISVWSMVLLQPMTGRLPS
jgi:hypothetical protein